MRRSQRQWLFVSETLAPAREPSNYAKQSHADLLRRARSGNGAASRQLSDFAKAGIKAGLPLTPALRDFTVAAIELTDAVGMRSVGKKPDFADNLSDALYFDSLKDQAAWLVFHQSRSPDPDARADAAKRVRALWRAGRRAQAKKVMRSAKSKKIGKDCALKDVAEWWNSRAGEHRARVVAKLENTLADAPADVRDAQMRLEIGPIGKFITVGAIRHWYDDRLLFMEEEQRSRDKILVELDGQACLRT